MAKKKPKKPTVDVDVDCPCCNALLRVKIWKSRANPSPPAEYEYRKEVTVDQQGKLFELPKKGKAKATAEPGGGRKKAGKK